MHTGTWGAGQDELWSCTPGSMLPLPMAVQDHGQLERGPQAHTTATRGGLQGHVPSTGTKAMAEMPDGCNLHLKMVPK